MSSEGELQKRLIEAIKDANWNAEERTESIVILPILAEAKKDAPMQWKGNYWLYTGKYDRSNHVASYSDILIEFQDWFLKWFGESK